MLGRAPGCDCELGVLADSIPDLVSPLSKDYLTGRQSWPAVRLPQLAHQPARRGKSCPVLLGEASTLAKGSLGSLCTLRFGS